MKVVILANGSQDKWAGHLGIPSHFIEIDGERILDRTLRQFASHGEIVISGPDARYHLPGTSLFTPRCDPAWLDADILYSTRPLWDAEGRTLIILGDVRFTDEAVAKITGHAPHEWAFFGRENPSTVTGTEWGELFAMSFWPENIPEGVAAMAQVLAGRQSGQLWRGGMWELYRIMEGIDPLVHEIRGRYVEIDDWTDDIDFPHVYEEFMSRWRAAHP